MMNEFLLVLTLIGMIIGWMAVPLGLCLLVNIIYTIFKRREEK